MRKCFQLIGGSHYKFWTVEVYDNHYLATFGRIGTEGQTQVKTFSTNGQALAKALDMIDEKTNKGYRAVGQGEHPGAKPQLLALLSGKAKVETKVEEEPTHTPGARRIVPLA